MIPPSRAGLITWPNKRATFFSCTIFYWSTRHNFDFEEEFMNILSSFYSFNHKNIPKSHVQNENVRISGAAPYRACCLIRPCIVEKIRKYMSVHTCTFIRQSIIVISIFFQKYSLSTCSNDS